MVFVHASKHEGAGNDFLVVLDRDDSIRLSVAQVRLLADRRRGVGADGIIRVEPGRDGCDLSMHLVNADGSDAEMSGNGIRCLAQAAVDAGWVRPPRFTVATAAGTRTVEYAVGPADGWASARVDMGPARLGPDQAQEFDDRRGDSGLWHRERRSCGRRPELARRRWRRRGPGTEPRRHARGDTRR